MSGREATKQQKTSQKHGTVQMTKSCVFLPACYWFRSTNQQLMGSENFIFRAVLCLLATPKSFGLLWKFVYESGGLMVGTQQYFIQKTYITSRPQVISEHNLLSQSSSSQCEVRSSASR